MASIIHIKNAPKDFEKNDNYVYIGRAGKGLGGYFGNPFPLRKEEDRPKTLLLYRNYFYGRLYTDPEFRAQIHDLINKTLVCFCKPKKCHGDIIIEYLHSHW